MKIAIWKTGHEIADTVAEALREGIPDASCCDTRIEGMVERCGCDIHIAYGILRGTEKVFRTGNHWFNVDKGYFGASHFDGTYRISYKGTQYRFPPVVRHVEKKILPGTALICPPTEHVCQFFGIDLDVWLSVMKAKCIQAGLCYEVRPKGYPYPINFKKYCLVVTFNSSVGWQALQAGVPCLSDTQHSVVGSYYNTKCIDELFGLWESMPTEPLFDEMRKHQFTLSEIKQGIACNLIYQCLPSSVLMPANP